MTTNLYPKPFPDPNIKLSQTHTLQKKNKQKKNTIEKSIDRLIMQLKAKKQ